ncbi:MAG: hypothetical protein GWN86_03020, partial [Desulfobacterales bacterium]|nr:hypothetical protein [Desulfobacterales bacterium]
EIREGIGDPEWAPASSILPGDYVVSPVKNHGSKIVSSEFAELVGWVASEGYLGKDGIIQFSFSEKNKSDIGCVKDCLEKNGLSVGVLNRPQ